MLLKVYLRELTLKGHIVKEHVGGPQIAVMQLLSERRYARRRLEKCPSKENIEIYKQISASAGKICSKCKKKAFISILCKFKMTSPQQLFVWRKIKAVKHCNSLDSMYLHCSKWRHCNRSL